MIYLIVPILGLVFLLFYEKRDRASERREWERERRELTNRVQAPQWVPSAVEPLPQPEPVPLDMGAWAQDPEIPEP